MISIDQLRVRQNRQDIHSIGSTLQKGTAAWLYQFWTKGILEHEPSNVPWILEHLVKIHFPMAHSSVQARWTSIRNANSSGFEHDVGQLSPGRSGNPTTCARESLWWKSKKSKLFRASWWNHSPSSAYRWFSFKHSCSLDLLGFLSLFSRGP